MITFETLEAVERERERGTFKYLSYELTSTPSKNKLNNIHKHSKSYVF